MRQAFVSKYPASSSLVQENSGAYSKLCPQGPSGNKLQLPTAEPAHQCSLNWLLPGYVDCTVYLGPLCFLHSFTPLFGLEGSVFIFVIVSWSEGVGYLILLFRAKEEKPPLPGWEAWHKPRLWNYADRAGIHDSFGVEIAYSLTSVVAPRTSRKRKYCILYMVIFSTKGFILPWPLLWIGGIYLKLHWQKQRWATYNYGLIKNNPLTGQWNDCLFKVGRIS